MNEPRTKFDTAVVIVDHGSRRTTANAVVSEVARMVQELLEQREAPGARVYWAHMELSEPSLAEAIDAAVGEGARTVVVQPLFLVPGRHAERDIPELIRAAQQRHPSICFRRGEVLGADPLLAELVLRRCGLS